MSFPFELMRSSPSPMLISIAGSGWPLFPLIQAALSPVCTAF